MKAEELENAVRHIMTKKLLEGDKLLRSLWDNSEDFGSRIIKQNGASVWENRRFYYIFKFL